MLTTLLDKIEDEKERVKQTWAESLLHDTRISKDDLKERYNRLTRLGKKIQRLVPELEDLFWGRPAGTLADGHPAHDSKSFPASPTYRRERAWRRNTKGNCSLFRWWMAENWK